VITRLVCIRSLFIDSRIPMNAPPAFGVFFACTLFLLQTPRLSQPNVHVFEDHGQCSPTLCLSRHTLTRSCLLFNCFFSFPWLRVIPSALRSPCFLCRFVSLGAVLQGPGYFSNFLKNLPLPDVPCCCFSPVAQGDKNRCVFYTDPLQVMFFHCIYCRPTTMTHLPQAGSRPSPSGVIPFPSSHCPCSPLYSLSTMLALRRLYLFLGGLPSFGCNPAYL